jgi:branched-chain amino acid transport system substrate-binding protein
MTTPTKFVTGFSALPFVSLLGIVCGSGLVAAGQYGPGAGDTEIKIGNSTPYSGPVSALGALGKAEAGYFAMVNEHGGIDGRKLSFISRDDGYSPPKTIEQTRKLVEEDQVLLIFGTVGTPPNIAIWDYLNVNKVPQLFIASSAAKWNDPKGHPWTMAWAPAYRTEARIYARYIRANVADAKIAVLYQNDDFGKDYLVGLNEGLGAQAEGLVVATQSYETTDPTVDSQIVTLQQSGANVFLIAATTKFAAMAIRKAYDIGWRPTRFLSYVSNSVGAVMRPAGLEKGVGIISAAFDKDPTDLQWQHTAAYQEWLAWMERYNSSASVNDALAVDGYSRAQTLVAVLKACGDNLTRENVMKQAANLHDLRLPMLLPGITISTSATDYAPMKQMQLERFDGSGWNLFGEVISESDS